MKKVLKFIGYSILAIIVFLIIGVLLVRFVFRDKVANFAYELLGEQYVEILQLSNSYKSDNVCFSFELLAPENKSKEIRSYFQLDSLISKSEDTWNTTLSIAQIVASIKHDNPDPKPTEYNAIDLWEWAKTRACGF